MTSSERKIPDIVTQYLTGERFDSCLILACIVWYTGTIRHNNTFTKRFVFEFLSVILLKIYPEKSLFFIESFSRKIFGLSLAKATLQNILLEIIETNEKWMKMFSCHFCVFLLQWVQSTGHYSVVKLPRTRCLVQTVANRIFFGSPGKGYSCQGLKTMQMMAVYFPSLLSNHGNVRDFIESKSIQCVMVRFW